MSLLVTILIVLYLTSKVFTGEAEARSYRRAGRNMAVYRSGMD